MARKHFISHLAHVEIITPKLEESANFFKEALRFVFENSRNCHWSKALRLLLKFS